MAQITRSVQWRCPQMDDHFYPHFVPMPCSHCYSLVITAERIPWQESEEWHPIEWSKT